MTLRKSTQLVTQRQPVTDNGYVVTKYIDNAIGIGVSPQLTIMNDRPAHITKYGDKASTMSIIILVHAL